MMWTAAFVMLVLWVVGLMTDYMMGGYIHLFLVAAVIIGAFNLMQDRKRIS